VTVELGSALIAAADRFAGRPALEVDGAAVSYDELRTRATAIAAGLAAHAPAEPRLTAVFASRSATSYAAVAGVLLRGHGYVPLNPHFPSAWNREILERSGCGAVVVDERSTDEARRVLAEVRHPLVVLLPDGAASGVERRRWSPHVAVPAPAAAELPPAASLDDPAYLLFTSGSTGRPKGVLVRRRNLCAFLDGIAARYDLDERDRMSQMFDLTFDLSAFDLLAAWQRGACVCVPRDAERLEPASFVRAAGLTVWFSVPSTAVFLRRFRTLKPGAFPTLRLSLFCGEALPAALAATWQEAAPNSVLDNLYGPTEATIACTAHRFSPGRSSDAGLVPIGRPFGETRVAIVDESLQPAGPGEAGELVLAGPQVVDGYFDDDVATERAFVEVTALGRAYRTGDRARADDDGTLQFLGRLDTQVKVLGHRVELEEIEAAIHEEAGLEAVAVAWPRTEAGAAGLVAVVAGPVDSAALRSRLASRLPEYMVPRSILTVDELPKNANGKRDRRAAAALVEGT
jgi:amino acid adenylation domain-containing protein